MAVVEWPYVVETGGMVFVLMGEQNGIYLLHFFPQHLLAKVGACVDDDFFVFYFKKCRNTKPFVAVVARTAHKATATDNRNAL